MTQILSEDEAYRRSGLDANGDPVHHIYIDNDGDTYFSATTVLDTLEDAEKEKHLQRWRDENDGENGTEHHTDLLKYSQLRGTLCHANAQEKYVDGQIWGKEEEMAETELQNFGEFKGEDAYKKCQTDIEWFVEEIQSMLDPQIEEVLFVEQYCYHTNPNYAGQVDFVYRDTDGDVVVCDLKTSKHVSYSYYLQSIAYANVIEEELGEEVGKIQIARANPDKQDSELHTVNTDEMLITATDVIEDEYGGHTVLLDAPFKAKSDIKDLNWDLFHQSWNDEHEQWEITVTNKDGSVTVDLACNLLADNWAVGVPHKIRDEVSQLPSVEEDDLDFGSINNTYQSMKDQTITEFFKLAEDINSRKPFTFPEDILQQNAGKFPSNVVIDTFDFIEEHKANLGDKHPQNILAAALIINGADKHKVTKELETTDDLEQTVVLYQNKL